VRTEINTWPLQNVVEFRYQLGRISLKNLGQVKLGADLLSDIGCFTMSYLVILNLYTAYGERQSRYLDLCSNFLQKL